MPTPPNWFLERRFFAARRWSNKEIRKLGPLFRGSAINVSGWLDSDKEGGRYRDYFPNLSSYSISNYAGDRGWQGTDQEIFLDLEEPIPAPLRQAFDLVINHTTLEHVFDLRQAFTNLCALSSDAVIVVAPWAQVHHSCAAFGDFWRFSPEALQRLFEAEGFSVIYISASAMTNSAIYVLACAVRDEKQWSDRHVPASGGGASPLGNWIGRPSLGYKILRRLRLQKILNIAPKAPDA